MRKDYGVALVTALALTSVLITIVAVLFAGSLGELRQGTASVQLAQARAIAEAGEVYARTMILESTAPTAIGGLINPYVDAFVSAGARADDAWIIPDTAWRTVADAIATRLNADHGALEAAHLGGQGRATLEYRVTDLRGISRSATAQAYAARYAITATGTSASGGRRRVDDTGSVQILIGRPPLSQYLFLVDDAKGTSGFFPTGSVFNGPVHSNTAWGFWGSPAFRDVASTSADYAWYWDRNFARRAVHGDSWPPDTVPEFAKGFLRGQPAVPLPTSALSQQRAALGLDPESDANGDGAPDAPAAADVCAALGFKSKTCGPPNGVYLVNNGSKRDPRVSGGLYVQGDADQIALSTDGAGKQVYTVKQGALTWTIAVDYARATTTVTAPTGTTTYAGVPNGAAPVGTGGATGQIYVTGRIRDLRGPARTGPVDANAPDHPPPAAVPPALALETQLNVTAAGEIGLTSDLTYECDPTKTADAAYQGAHPRCATGAPPRTVLGVMSQSADLVVTSSAPNDLYLWGSYLSGSSGHGLAVEDYSTRAPQGKLRVFGGLIQSVDHLRGTIDAAGRLTSGYLETFDYDARFANGALAPPNFPTVRNFRVQQVVTTPLTFFER